MTSDSFVPDWTDKPPQPGSFRSIIKIADQSDIRTPSRSQFELLKRTCKLSDEDFRAKRDGNEPVRLDQKITLEPQVLETLARIVGEENMQCDDYSRIKYGHGKLQEEMINLRRGIVEKVPNAVLHPRSKEDVQELVTFCNQQRIPIYVYGGGSSVSKGLRCEKGGITLVLNTHMNKVLEVNELNQTARVQAGCMGPDFEHVLNHAPTMHQTKHRYTCGHFPQSFEISSVGGWMLTLGSGQASTYYGDAADLAISVEVVTPAGIIRTREYRSTATGPKVIDMMKGSEGAFGILTELTVKIFRYMPENRRYFSYLFPNWKAAVDATREISQGEFGLPAVLRISDAHETDHGMQIHKPSKTAEQFLRWRGYKAGQRCGCMGTIEGDADYTKLVKMKIRRIARQHGGMSLGRKVVQAWEKERYKSFLVAESLTDYGFIFDTVETPVLWDNIHKIHAEVRAYAHRFPNAICMSHASHFYATGTNLYFIFGLKADIDEYRQFRTGMIDAMVQAGGSPSHHHGVGRLMAPWMERFLGTLEMDTLRALKKHFDENNIMNPGGHLGLDLPNTRRSPSPSESTSG